MASIKPAMASSKKTKLSIILLWLVSVGAAVGLSLWLSRDRPAYPLSYEANFIAGCLNKKATVYACVCPLRYVENHYSYKQALTLDDTANTTGRLPRELQQVFNDCAKQH
jgi:hypothetical protein